jgi:small subunit ribosomal protein S6
MRKYETLMVLHPELPEAQTRETIDRARRLLEGVGAQVQQVQEWGMRDLAYPIRKLSRGYYVLMEYTCESKTVTELERTLKIADEVLRFISVAVSTVRRQERPAKARRRQDSQTGSAMEGEPTGVD